MGTVAVPAMIAKIIRWSRRCRRAMARGPQVPRWYRALAPNIPATLAA